MPKVAVMRNFVLNHMIHHRGQFVVYLRMLGVPVPSIYGPSRRRTDVGGIRTPWPKLRSGISTSRPYVLLKPLRALVTVNDAVLLRRHLDPVRRPVVHGRRRRCRPGRRRRHRRDRHRRRLLVDQVGDEQPGHGVFLAAQQREVHLPEILEARRGVDDLHRVGLPALARAVVHDGDARLKRVHEHLASSRSAGRDATRRTDRPCRCGWSGTSGRIPCSRSGRRGGRRGTRRT